MIYRHIGRFDRETAYFSATPGGLIEAITLGEEAGGDPATLTLLQFSRLLVCIITVPLAFTVLGEEETRIREDPLARTTELLKRVFA